LDPPPVEGDAVEEDVDDEEVESFADELSFFAEELFDEPLSEADAAARLSVR
jgi:hypothetical protein